MIDLLVAGAGPVGLATALYAARAGLSVTVLDPRLSRPGPLDKACGEGLMPAAVRALADLDVCPDGVDLQGIHYADAQVAVRARFRHGAGRGVARTVLHVALMRAADAAGIDVRAGRIDTVHQDESGVCAGGVLARYLAAADGLHSPIRRGLALDRPTSTSGRYGLRRHYRLPPWTDFVEVHWSAGLEAYVTPVGANLVGVALLTSTHGSFDQQLQAFPELARRLAGAGRTSVLGAGPMRQRTRARVAGRVLLVGDAAGYVDALTGEGIAVGLAAARELVRCLLADRPGAYERAWLRVSRPYRIITQTLVWTRRQPLLASKIVPAAGRAPRLFSAAVNQLGRG